uniref:Peptidase C19 ubiquitin carboxyl-terminal hydrolase domain-containing protein n=1 Tax=Kwoniella bestiolae CBS 10118 TaxID=1296100 RepID=A0A1B9GFB9_9TREE|nr:hypothetical protein I302_01176 [Kwoniella bestiolae CBS 10118]OCF29665.1 hypothetical protein I302_01176 [Kwoniella bestiolae CBS 10118]
MSLHELTFNSLKEMGIDPTIAREAASRFHSVEPAVNWCFGDGANWTPEAPKPHGPPSYDSWRPQRAYGTSVEHREVIDVDAPSSAEPTPSPQPFQSNNPFRQHLSPPPPLPKRNIAPAPSLTPTVTNDDEDEDLRRAIELSQQSEGIAGAGDNEENRQKRERSVRATGPPPPSPTNQPIDMTGNDADNLDLGTLFGPSNKDDAEGKLAMVPSSQNNTNTMSKEDEDMDRAIQESLMTASFHSASNAQDTTNKPTPTERLEGAPLVLYSESGHSTYAANLFQAMYAVPQLREAVASVIASNQAIESSHKGKIVSDLYNFSLSSKSSFIEVDEQLKAFRDGREPNQLPPGQPATGEYTRIYYSRKAKAPYTDATNFLADLHHLLFKTHVDSDPPQHSSYVTFMRSSNLSPDIYSHLSQILWNADSDSQQQSLIELGDILTVMLDWAHGAKREVWKLEERVVLDRFMKSNATYSAQKRAHQSVMAGNARRTQEKIDRLTMHEGNDYQQSISALIEHLENSPSTEDEMQKESRREMKEKLEKILKVLRQRVTTLQTELEEHTKAASGSVFETDDPAYNQHVYILRGILFQDGALVGGNHLYAYIKGEDGRWWKVQEYQVEEVEWKTITEDKTGLWMDGGAYMLLYSREGPRPSPAPSSSNDSSQIDLSPTKTIRNDNATVSVPEGDLIDISMTTNSSIQSTRQNTPEPSLSSGQTGEDGERDVEMKCTSTLVDRSERLNLEEGSGQVDRE